MPLRFGSLLQRREEKLFDSIEKYVETVVEAVKGFEEMLEAVKRGRMGRISEIYREIDARETEADEIRRTISEELSKGTFFSHLKEDFLNLVEEVDNLADWTKDAAKILVETTPSWDILHFVFNLPEMERYVNLCVKASEKLLKAVKTLRRAGRETVPILHEIEDLEEAADEVKIDLTRSLLREAKRFDVLDVIQVKEMIYLLDNVCDSAEDASDIILLIIAKAWS